MALYACPFCREMFPMGETRACPVCGVALKPLDALPLSHDAADDDGVPAVPELEPFALTYAGRGRGLLLVLGLVGLGLFFLPWIRVTLPENVDMSGFDVARRLGWSWAAGVAWAVLVPTVLSRRTIFQLRGARVAAAFLSAFPAATVGILLARPPHGGIVPLRFTFGWALFATLGVSFTAVAVAFRLGGSPIDIRVERGSSSGQTVH